MENRLGRRALLRASLGGGLVVAAAAAAAPSMSWAAPSANVARSLSLLNLHTGETFTDVYFENGGYVSGAVNAASRVLRDWRNNEVHAIEPKLFDTLFALQSRLEVNRPFQVISGYRSPQTNAKLHARSNGVATRSLHMLGQAIDVRVSGVELQHLHKAALNLGAGGVGYYPQSNFVHVDVGRKRQWAGA